MSDVSFQEQTFLLLDRLERTVELLKDQLRTADEFILACQQRVQQVVDQQTPDLPAVTLFNGMPQTLGFQARWDDGHFVIHVGHRGEADLTMLPPQQQAQIEVVS